MDHGIDIYLEELCESVVAAHVLGDVANGRSIGLDIARIHLQEWSLGYKRHDKS